LPKIRIAVPKVNGIDNAIAQGHATINTDEKAIIALSGFTKYQNIPAEKAMLNHS